MSLSVRGLAIGGGVMWGIYMLFIGWAAAFGWGLEFVQVMSSIYGGFAPSILGGIIGGIWGFVDGAIAGAIIALVYNRIAGEPSRF